MAHVIPPQEVSKPKDKKPSVAGTIGLSALGLGGGMLAGAGLGKAMEAISRRQGIDLPRAIPLGAQITSGALGMAYPWWKHHEQQRINSASESP